MTAPIRFYARLEHDQWDFARTHRDAYEAALIPAKYLARYPEGHPSRDHPPDRLRTAVISAQRPLVVEPGTPALMSKGVVRYDSAARLRETAAAGAVTLPLTIEQLQSARTRDEFVEASLIDQIGSSVSAAPNLEFRNIRDPRFEVNLHLMRRMVRVAANDPVSFVQVTYATLRDGALAEAAPAIAATGIRRVFLRVREIGDDVDDAGLDHYLQAVDAVTGMGVAVVADCVGRLGPVLIASGAEGFSAGSSFFRKVPQVLLAPGGGGGGAPVGYETVDLWSEVDRALRLDGALTPCPVAGCRATEPGATLDELWAHKLHTFRRLGDDAANRPVVDLIRSLRASGDALAVQWANVLVRRQRRAA